MSIPGEAPQIGGFKAWLSLWIGLAMALGLALGSMWPSAFQYLGAYSVGEVNPVTAVLVWMLILPTMVQVDYSKLGALWTTSDWVHGSVLTLLLNWFIKPFSMAALAIVFLKGLYVTWILPSEADQFVAGLVLLGIAPCTGMVFVWSRMTQGDPSFTLAQVSLNDLVLIFAFAPLSGLLLDLAGVSVPWYTLSVSVAAYVVAPLVVGYLLRLRLLRSENGALARFDGLTGPLTKIGLILLVVLLFAFQASTIIDRPFVIFLIAIPLLLQSYGVFLIAFAIGWMVYLPKRIVAPAALIGTSNFFELAVAVAIALFGVNSAAVVATIVGVLVEIPVMLSLVWLLNRVGYRFDQRCERNGEIT